jgi:hypothetical protein
MQEIEQRMDLLPRVGVRAVDKIKIKAQIAPLFLEEINQTLLLTHSLTCHEYPQSHH